MFSMIFSKQFWTDLYAEISEDNVFNGAAALGYYLMLSIFPAFIMIMTVIPYLPIENVDQAIMDLLHQGLPEESATLLQDTVSQITQQQRGGLLSFGIIATLWTVSSGMYAIMQQLNITYDVTEGRNFVMARLTAILLSIAFIVLVVGAFALIVMGGVLESWVMSIFGDGQLVVLAFQAFRWIVILLALLLGFAIIYRYAPNVEQKFAFITPGAVLGVVLLILASLAFTIYIQNFGDYSATYGSIGAVIILMVWLYILGLVLLVGSEINALVEHYSPEGKQKGEKTEGARAGGSPQGDAPAPRPAAARRPARLGKPSLIPLAALLVLRAFESRQRRDGDTRRGVPGE